MRLKPQAERFYMPELDTLRFFAFLGVFLLHSFEVRDFGNLPRFLAPAAMYTVQAGMFGVDLFFLLSSYLITSLLLREHSATGMIDIPGFWIRRCLRIWPLYFFAVGVGGFLLPAIFHFVASPDHVYVVGLLTFTQNWSAAFSDIGGGNPTLVLWSVSIEEQFYFIWPILIVMAGVKRLRPIAIAMIIISSVARLCAIHAGASWNMLWYATPLRLEPLAAGALIALAGNQQPKFNVTIRAGMLCAGIAIPVLCMVQWIDSKWFEAARFPLATAGCSLIFLAVRGWTSKFLTSRPLVYLGKISYGLYVFHALALAFSPRINIGIPHTIVAFILTVIFAAVSYRWLELPFLRLKDRFAHIQSRPA